MNKRLERGKRPVFPKRVVVTGGMSYGNKTLHFGHVGGMFVHADIFACFLRDRIGEDNIYFYAIAEMAMLTALKDFKGEQLDMEKINLPHIISNRHVLFMDTKASSSSEIKPPMADELLEHYTPEQLRMHFMSLGLSSKSVGFKPQVYMPQNFVSKG